MISRFKVWDADGGESEPAEYNAHPRCMTAESAAVDYAKNTEIFDDQLTEAADLMVRSSAGALYRVTIRGTWTLDIWAADSRPMDTPKRDDPAPESVAGRTPETKP